MQILTDLCAGTTMEMRPNKHIIELGRAMNAVDYTVVNPVLDTCFQSAVKNSDVNKELLVSGS